MATPLSFGIKTTPAHVDYEQIRRVWLEADAIPEIEHAWLYDHLLPRVDDPAGQAHECWTLLAALAAQTTRLRFGVLVTNNRIRHPALLAKIAATLDVVSGGRLDVGIGVGGLPAAALGGTNVAQEFGAYGIPQGRWSDAVAAFAEACTLLRRMWTETEAFDVDGEHYRLRAVHCAPRPVQRPHPPLLIGGTGAATLPIIAEHAGIWNVLGPPVHTVEQLRGYSARLDEHCAAIGRDPREIVRSAELPALRYDDPAAARDILAELVAAGFGHLVIKAPAPYPDGVARWVTDELITPTLRRTA